MEVQQLSQVKDEVITPPPTSSWLQNGPCSNTVLVFKTRDKVGRSSSGHSCPCYGSNENSPPG